MAKDDGKLVTGGVHTGPGKAVSMTGVKITRPGTGYYFDDEVPKCPLCGNPDLEYRCRVKGKPATAQFKCPICMVKFEKTRTITCLYYRDLKDVQVEIAPTLKCGNCSSDLGLSTRDFEMAERVVCPGCNKLCKGRTEEVEAAVTDESEED